jgi:mannose-6-phosphate isomerase-like protein (cupin superfamily)
MEVVNVADKFGQFSEAWRPKVVAELNGQELKLVKMKGEFPWHHHEVDELFMVYSGCFRLETEAGSFELQAGELIVVPAGVEHRPVAEEECHIFLLEPAGVKNTGNVEDATYTAPKGVRI